MLALGLSAPPALDAADLGVSLAPIPVLVVGVGNFLMGDEGVGVHLLHALEADPPGPGVRLLDGGTGGVNLLPAIEAARRVVMIDATRDGRPAGTVTLLRPRCAAELPRGLSAHDFGVKDLFAAAAWLGRFPDIYLFTVSVETIHPMTLELSAPVAASLASVLVAVRHLAAELAHEESLAATA